MAMLRSSRTLLSKFAGAFSIRSLVGIRSFPLVNSNDKYIHASSSPSPGASPAASWRALVSPSVPFTAGVALTPTPAILNIQSRCYSKRPKKWQGGPHAFVQVEPGVPVPPYQPNEGSVKNRKHKKRMAQRDAFAKAQAQKRKAETKAALIARDAARRKRWREGAARARAWAQQQAKAAAEQEPTTVLRT